MKIAKNYRSPFSRRTADHLHHVTARDSDGNYLDPKYVVPLTVTEHAREHQSWTCDFADGRSGDPDFLRASRAATLWIRLGDHHEGGSVHIPSEFARQTGLLFQRLARRISKGSV